MKKIAFFVLCVSLLGTPAYGKGKPGSGGGGTTTPDIPAEVTMRCPGVDCASTDRIQGDFGGSYGGDVTRYFFNTDGGHGALWMYVDLPRTFMLDFTEQDGLAPCAISNSGCRRDFVIINTPSPSPATAINPTDANDVVLPEGFFSIPVGGSAYARVKINFPDPSGRNILWTVRFNSGAYAGSTNVTVRRLSEDVWEVEATAEDRARLVSVSTGKGRSVSTDEGLFVMPFKMTVVRQGS